ncbi:MAG: serine/threonine protein kinase [Candidatus Melainabacteria bacterium]|nr:serine/threonine protein kinase [Candidatus Melainabacteria bacterium]
MTKTAPTKTCPRCGHEDSSGLAVCPKDGTALKSKKPKAADKFIGTTIADKYHIESLLGRGGMSVVYKAKHLLMDRTVAVKMLRQDLVSVPQLLERFKQESKAVSALRHQNIITVFDFGLLPDATPYLIMDYLEGQTLAEILKTEKRLSPERALPLFAQACDALAHSHSRGVVHRDIKPGNLLVRQEPDGTESLTIFDFGIAKMLGQDGSTINKLTSSGEVFGSPLYMSPEQCSGEKIDARSDIYSLACVFHELVLGVPPFRGDSPMDTLMRHLNDPVKPFSESAPDVQLPPGFEEIITKALSKDPEDRYKSMSEFRDEILRVGNLSLQLPHMLSSASHQVVTSSQSPLESGAQASIKSDTTDKRPDTRLSRGAQSKDKGGSSFGKTAATVVGIVALFAAATGGLIYGVNQWNSQKNFVIPDKTDTTGDAGTDETKTGGGEEGTTGEGAGGESGKSENDTSGTGDTGEQSGTSEDTSGGTDTGAETGSGSDQTGTEDTATDLEEGQKTFTSSTSTSEAGANIDLQVNRLPYNEVMKFTALPKRHGWYVDLTETIKPTTPAALLPKGTSPGKGRQTTCRIHLVELGPSDTSLADAAGALYQKIFAEAGAQWREIGLPGAPEGEELFLQEIAYPDKGNVTEFVLYLKRGSRLIACEFVPSKATREQMLELIKDFVSVVSVAVEAR